MAQGKQISIRLNQEILDKTRAAAKKENRTLNNYIETVLINKFKKEEK